MTAPDALRTCTVGGATIAYRDAGAGPPVLLLHGNPDSSTLWAPLIERLAPRYRCLAPDLPGFGHSGVPDVFDSSLLTMAWFVEAFRQAVGLDAPLRLVLHDFGGPYGLAWAVQHPERVAGLALINTLFFADYRWHRWGRIWRTPMLGELSLRFATESLLRWEMRRSSPTLSDEHLRATYRLAKRPQTQQAILQLYRAADPERFAGWEVQMLTLTARTPTLVLWGLRDPYIPPRYAHRFGTDRVQLFPHSGHWLPLEAPNAVAEHLLVFFRACRRATAS